MEIDESGVSLPSGPDARKRRVSYFYEPTIGDYYYGQGHPMKPHRIRMAHSLIVHYHLHRRLEISRPNLGDAADIGRFHSPEYVDFLASVSPESMGDPSSARKLKRFNVGEDCPVFDGLFDFCRASAGGSIGAAVKLNRQDADIAINWGGGLHHAKKSEASGFCYVNDIVLGILELLKMFRRVLYIDIDVHHGDGVEEAFYTTDRVMTVSFHKFGDFFPGTGHIRDVGAFKGKYYALNVPLNNGMDDESFRRLFRPLIQKVMEVYQPEAVVLQCGADSLSGDRLGCFNLSVKGHADCLRFLRSYNVPLMVLGGGGYTIRNVARCWCYETAVAVGVEPDNKLPYNEYFEYFGPDYTLHVEPSPMENLNTPKDMEKIRNTLLEQLSGLIHAPSVPFQHTPPVNRVLDTTEEEDLEKRPKPRIWSGTATYESDSDDDEKPLHGFSGIGDPSLDMDSTGEDEMEDDNPEPEKKKVAMAKELVSLQFLSPVQHISRQFLSLSPPSTLNFRPKAPIVLPRSTTHSHRNRTSHDDDGIPANEVKTIAKFKSRLNYIRVIEVSRKTNHPLAGSRLLLLDNPGNIHSISFLLKTLTGSYFDVFATLPPIIPPGPIGVLGFGAGSTARLILELYPPEITIHGWEIDPSVIDVGREFFGLSKLERDHKDRIFINIGDALNASVKTGFSGILVDLFSKGSVIKELQDPKVWENLKCRLRKRGRIMVNVGGRCVEAEDSERDGDLVMEETLKAMSQVFGDKLFVLTLGNGNDSSLALTGDLPDLDAWKKKLPLRELGSYVDMWKPFTEFSLS